VHCGHDFAGRGANHREAKDAIVTIADKGLHKALSLISLLSSRLRWPCSMLSLATSRSKTPSALPSDPNIRLGLGETAAKAVFLFRVRHFGECLLLALSGHSASTRERDFGHLREILVEELRNLFRLETFRDSREILYVREKDRAHRCGPKGYAPGTLQSSILFAAALCEISGSFLILPSFRRRASGHT
jgi:hypothetical protein